jgi:hypothetical protein
LSFTQLVELLGKLGHVHIEIFHDGRWILYERSATHPIGNGDGEDELYAFIMGVLNAGQS